MPHFETLIIGGGAVGTSAFFQLARRGSSVALLEKRPGFGRGATGVWGALVRMFHADLQTTRLATQSVPYYQDFENHVGEPFQWTQTGSLYFLDTALHAEVERHLTLLRASGLPFELLGAAEGKRRFPDFCWYEQDTAIYEPLAGVACPTGTTAAFIRGAQSHGGVAYTDADVVELIREGERVSGVRTRDGKHFTCDQLIVCSGIWTNCLLEGLGKQVAAFPKSIQLNRYCRHHEPMQHPFFIDRPSLTFGHPTQSGSFIGGYLGSIAPASGCRMEHVNPQQANLAKHKLAQRLPWLKTATLEGGIKALESYTASGQGLVERLESFSNVIVSTGWSCTGFTLAPVIGQRIAELALEEPSFLASETSETELLTV